MAAMLVTDTSSQTGTLTAEQVESLAGSSVEAAGPAKDIFQAVVLGTDADSDIPHDDDSDIVTCIECDRPLEKV